MYDGCAIMVSILIATNSSKPSWNASEGTVGRFAKGLKPKYTQVATPQLHDHKRWPNIDVLENDVLPKTFAKFGSHCVILNKLILILPPAYQLFAVQYLARANKVFYAYLRSLGANIASSLFASKCKWCSEFGLSEL